MLKNATEDSLHDEPVEREPTKCDDFYNSSAFNGVYTSTRTNSNGWIKWYVRCTYQPNFYEPVSDLNARPNLSGPWKYVPGRGPYEPASWECDRSASACRFFSSIAADQMTPPPVSDELPQNKNPGTKARPSS